MFEEDILAHCGRGKNIIFGGEGEKKVSEQSIDRCFDIKAIEKSLGENAGHPGSISFNFRGRK